MAPSKKQSHHNESNSSQGPSEQTMIRAIREIIEPLFREVVQEETESALRSYLCPGQSLNETGAYEGRDRALRLNFDKSLPDETFTQSEIVAEDGTLLQISLRNAQNRIVRDGPLSSITIKLFVLNGDFGSSGGSEHWTAKEFNASILHKTRKGGELLAGDKFVKLKNGVGSVNYAYVTDISKWARQEKFRLGAKIVESTPEGENIREGVSEAFRVKDKRGKTYKNKRRVTRSWKHKKAWRLRKTAKDGKRHEQMRKHEVLAAKDALPNNDPHLLEQVRSCAVHEQDNTGLQSNDGQPCIPVQSFDSEHKHVYENLQAEQGLQQFDFPTINQDFCVASTSTWHIGEAARDEQIGRNELAELAEGPLYSDADEQSFSELEQYLGEDSWLLEPSYIPSGGGAECSYHSSAVNKSSKGKAKTIWRKIRNAFKVNMLCGAIRKAKLCDF